MKAIKRLIVTVLALSLCMGIFVKTDLSAKAATDTVVITTTMECSIWSAPATLEENRVKKIPSGWNVTIIPVVVDSTICDGKTFYQTAKGCYILCKCCDGNEVNPVPVVTNHVATVGEKQAVKKAQQYLKVLSFSRDGLVDQLIYEKFSQTEAEYGADNCGADWNTQAIKQAKSYLKVMSFSRVGLIDQLKYEKYTDAQAIFGADNCGANWYEQAGKKAQSYMSLMSFSRDGLIDQLIYEGFLPNEIAYGIAVVGY